MDKLFFEVIRNKYLFNKILNSFSSISYENIASYRKLYRLKFKSINQLSFIVEKRLWNIFLDKIRSNQFITIDTSNSFKAFISLFNEESNFNIVVEFYQYIKKNKVIFPENPLISSIVANSPLAIKLFAQSKLYQVSDIHYLHHGSLSNIKIFKTLLELDDDGITMSIDCKRVLLRKLVESGNGAEPILRFVLDNPKYYLINYSNSDHRVLLYYFSFLKSMDLKYRIMDLNIISTCDSTFFQHYHMRQSLGCDPSKDNFIFNIRLYYKLVLENELPDYVEDAFKFIQDSDDQELVYQRALEILDGISFNKNTFNFKEILKNKSIYNNNDGSDNSGSGVINTKMDSGIINSYEQEDELFNKNKRRQISITRSDYKGSHNFIVSCGLDSHCEAFTNALSSSNIEVIKEYDKLGKKLELVKDYIKIEEESQSNQIVEEQLDNSDYSNSDGSNSGSSNGFDEDLLFGYIEQRKALNYYYSKYISFKKQPYEKTKELISYLNESGYKCFTDGMFKVFLIQLVIQFGNSIVLEIDFSKFQNVGNQLLIFYAAYGEYSVVKDLFSNSTFKYNSNNIDNDIIESIVRSQSFPYTIFENSSTSCSNIESIEILSIINLLVNHTNPQSYQSLQYLFNHLYKELLYSSNVSYQQLVDIRSLYKSINIEIIEDSYTIFYYLYIRSNKLALYIIDHPFIEKLFIDHDLQSYDCSNDYSRFLSFDIKDVLKPFEFSFEEIFNGRFNDNFKILFLKLRNKLNSQIKLTKGGNTINLYQIEKKYLLKILRIDIFLQIIKEEVGSINFKINKKFCKQLSPNNLYYILNNININSDQLTILNKLLIIENRNDLIEILNNKKV